MLSQATRTISLFFEICEELIRNNHTSIFALNTKETHLPTFSDNNMQGERDT